MARSKGTSINRLLLDEAPLQVLPSLAVAIGLNEAIVLQQMHYWLKKSKTEIDNRKWIYNSYENWTDQFPFWSKDTIGRTIRKLEKIKIVETENLSNNRFDKTKYYTINYNQIDSLCTLDDGKLLSGGRQSAMTEDSNLQPSEHGNLPSSYRQRLPETTTETTTRDIYALSDGFDKFWSAYPKKRSKNQAEKAWAKIKPDQALLSTMLDALELHKASKEWTKDNGQFIPFPATWLNQARWDDELELKGGEQTYDYYEQRPEDNPLNWLD